jgi:MFS family permease
MRLREAAMSYGRIFRNAPYRNFWLGSTFSYVGDAMTNVALVWLVYSSTGSPGAVALLLVCYTAPVVVGGLVAGSLLDRFDRRMVMIVDNSIRGAAVASVPVLYWLGMFALWEVYLVALVYGFFYMITLAGAPSIIPDMVEENQLTTANSLETITFTLSGVMGPPLAGIIILHYGAQNVMIVDAISYATLVIALASFRLRSATTQKTTIAQKATLRDAFRLLLSNRILLSTTLMFMFFNLGEGVLALWLPILSKTVLLGGPELYGILLGAMAVGQVAGASVAGNLPTRWSIGKLIITTQSLSGVSFVLIFASTQAWLVGTALALLGFLSAPLTAWAQTLRMRIIPAELRGRTFALLRTLMQAASPTGSGVAGLVLPVIGLMPLIGLSAVLIGSPGLAGSQVKELRDAGSPS